jgi:hypothetical protein
MMETPQAEAVDGSALCTVEAYGALLPGDFYSAHVV